MWRVIVIWSRDNVNFLCDLLANTVAWASSVFLVAMFLTFVVHLSLFIYLESLFLPLFCVLLRSSHPWGWTEVSKRHDREKQLSIKEEVKVGRQMWLWWWFDAGHLHGIDKGNRGGSPVLRDHREAFQWRGINSIIVAWEEQGLSIIGPYRGGRSIMTSQL